MTALTVGCVFSVVRIISQLLSALVIAGGGYIAASIPSGVGTLLSVLLEIVALVLGIVGLRRSGAPRTAAAAGTALGAVALLDAIGTAIYLAVISAL